MNSNGRVRALRHQAVSACPANAFTNSLVGVAGVAMALCCLAGPAVLGAAAGAAIGNLLGTAAAIAVAAVALLLLWRCRTRTGKAC